MCNPVMIFYVHLGVIVKQDFERESYPQGMLTLKNLQRRGSFWLIGATFVISMKKYIYESTVIKQNSVHTLVISLFGMNWVLAIQ